MSAPNVKCVGQSLVAGFDKAVPPLIWKFDLDRNHSFTLALQGGGEDWKLGVTTFKGEFDVVAHFTSREAAQEAFERVQKALMARRRSLSGRIFNGMLLVIAAVLLFFVGNRFYAHWNTIQTLQQGLPMQQAAPVQMENGIPLPADQVLKPPH